MMDNDTRLLTVLEVQNLLGTSSATMSRRIKNGTIKHIRLRGRILIPIESIAGLLEEAEAKKNILSGINKDFFTLPDASKALRVSRTTLWRLIRDGSMPTTSIARRIFIPAEYIVKLIADSMGV
jgi:excisionase family DNA binding protein